MRTALLVPSSPEWARSVASVAADIYYLPDYVVACARREGGQPLLFIAAEGGNLWLQPIIVRQIPGQLRGSWERPLCDAVSPYGYSGPLVRIADGRFEDWSERAAAHFRECLADHRIVTAFIRLHPILNRDVAGVGAQGRLTLRGRTVVVDLTLPADAQRAALRLNHRRHIARAQRAGFVATIEDDPAVFPVFRQVYLEAMDRLGGSSYHRALVEDLPQLAAHDDSSLYVSVVRKDGEVACMGLFTAKGGIVQYHLGATANNYTRYSPSKMMMQHAIEVARDRGNRLFHLGGGIGGANDSLFHFKAGFSGATLPFYTWDMIVDEPAYRALLARMEDLLPAGDPEAERYFPRYRARPAGDLAAFAASIPAKTLALF